MLDIRETEEVAVLGVVAGVGGDGEFFVGMGVEGGVLVGGFGWGGFFLLFGVAGSRQDAESYYEGRNCRDAIGLHGLVDYHLG